MQRPHLTAKVFRYLRTLRYKAAISRGFLLHQIFDNLVISVNQPAPGRSHTQYLDLSSWAECCVLISKVGSQYSQPPSEPYVLLSKHTALPLVPQRGELRTLQSTTTLNGWH
jgi:hypothetical protein